MTSIENMAARYRAAEARYRRVQVCDRVKDAYGWGTVIRLNYARVTNEHGSLTDVRLISLGIRLDQRGIRSVNLSELDHMVDVNGDAPLMPFGEACLIVARQIYVPGGEWDVSRLVQEAMESTSLGMLAKHDGPPTTIWRAWVRVLQSTQHERRASGLFYRH